MRHISTLSYCTENDQNSLPSSIVLSFSINVLSQGLMIHGGNTHWSLILIVFSSVDQVAEAILRKMRGDTSH